MAGRGLFFQKRMLLSCPDNPVRKGEKMTVRKNYWAVSPSGYRYLTDESQAYLSEVAYMRRLAEVEWALLETLAEFKVTPPEAAADLWRVVGELADDDAAEAFTEEVYAEEGRIKHDIRALVNVLRRRMQSEYRCFVHVSATSYDIITTANAFRYREFVRKVLVPEQKRVAAQLHRLCNEEADTIQVFRTHGQHAEPGTFGMACAVNLSRMGEATLAVEQALQGLRPKFSGAVGCYNGIHMLGVHALAFERGILQRVGLEPAEASTQIAPPEPLIRLLSEVVLSCGVLANIARDLRNLQRTEINEVAENQEGAQVGSSTMPQKKNPIGNENTESLWKAVRGRLMTAYEDQVSEHQRDLTGSASARATVGEILEYAHYAHKRMAGILGKLGVYRNRMRENLGMTGDQLLAEPLQILLSVHGHPDGHEVIRLLSLQARETRQSLFALAEQDASLAPFLAKFTPAQRALLSGDPAAYTGIAAERARQIAYRWNYDLKLADFK